MASNIFRARPLWQKLLGSLVLLFAALLVALVFFPWDVLREPVNRYVSEKTGRKFEITRRLDVDLGWRAATVKFDGIEFANPSWARDPYLVKAERAEFDIRIWPLVASRIVIPRLALSSPTLGLQMEQDGRRTWALGKDTSDSGTVPSIGLMQIDSGAIDFLAKHLGVDLHADVNYDTSRGDLPLSYRIKGRYKGQPLTADGRTGNVLQINAAGAPPFPLEINAAAGQTRLKATGTVAELAGLDGIDAKFQLKGQTLGALFPLLGIALPQTSPYALSGDLSKCGKLWQVAGLKGKLGLSDIAGDMRFDQTDALPHLAGELRSGVMDMDDLGPLIGLPPTARSANAIEGVAPPPSITQVKRPAGGKVLPTAPLDFDRLRAMNADVKYTADRIQNVREIPLDRGSVQVKLNNGVFSLDPLDLGVGGGKLVGAIRIDAVKNPADIRASLDLRGVQLARLIPKLETTGNSVGRLDGRINLSGPGSSVANWLGGASGDVAVLSGRGPGVRCQQGADDRTHPGAGHDQRRVHRHRPGQPHERDARLRGSPGAQVQEHPVAAHTAGRPWHLRFAVGRCRGGPVGRARPGCTRARRHQPAAGVGGDHRNGSGAGRRLHGRAGGCQQARRRCCCQRRGPGKGRKAALGGR